MNTLLEYFGYNSYKSVLNNLYSQEKFNNYFDITKFPDTFGDMPNYGNNMYSLYLQKNNQYCCYSEFYVFDKMIKKLKNNY